MQSFREFIYAHWQTPDQLAELLDLPAGRVRHWSTRDAIPDEYWLVVIDQARQVKRMSEATVLRSFAKFAEARRLRKNGKLSP